MVLIFGSGELVNIIGAALSVAGAGMLALDLRARRADARATRIVANPGAAARLSALSPPPKRVGRSSFVTDPTVNALLDPASNTLAETTSRYRVPKPLSDHVAHCIDLDRPHFNDQKIGLRTDINESILRSNSTITVQQTDYFCGVATNERTMDRFEVLPSGVDEPPRPPFAPIDWVIADGRLLPLRESPLSNHIGITTLTLTADDHLVIQQQGEQVEGRFELNLGGSGSADWADLMAVSGRRTLQAMLRFAMEREAVQETGIATGDGQSRTTLTGHARYPERGGKPEFFGITRTRSTIIGLKAHDDEKQFVADIYGIPFQATPQGLLTAIDLLLDEEAQSRRPYSLSMSVSLRLARDWIAHHGLPPGP